MKRTFLRILICVLFPIAMAGGGFWIARYITQQASCSLRKKESIDSLYWLVKEYHLSKEQLAKVRKVHEQYLPDCQFYCRKIAEAKAELRRQLNVDHFDSKKIGELLQQIALLRAQCQKRMLEHFAETAALLPEPAKKRYFSTMVSFVLEKHSEMEHQMTTK